MAKDRVTIQEAARRLGVKDDAIRKRIQRGTLEHEKNPDDGRVYVFLDATQDEPDGSAQDSTRHISANGDRDAAKDTSRDALVDALQEEVVYLRGVIDRIQGEMEARTEEIRRRDHIIMVMAQRIPELEAPKAHETTAGEPGGVEPRPADEGAQGAAERRPLWRRLLFGE